MVHYANLKFIAIHYTPFFYLSRLLRTDESPNDFYQNH